MSYRALTALPVYNEVEHVSAALDGALNYSDAVLVVDDGSTDGTSEVLAARDDVRVLTHPRNLGYGAALRSAFDFALRRRYDALVTIDCDGQHQPQLIPRFVETVHEADIVSGSRYLRKFPGDSEPPFERRRINQVMTEEINRRLGLNLTDSFCGFKAYRVPVLARFCLTDNGYAMPLELWVQAARLGLKIVEVAVPLIYLDERRSFGGALDQADTRIAVYRSVLDRAIAAAEHLLPAEGAATARSHGPVEGRHFSAPGENGGALVNPPFAEVAGLVAENVRLRGRGEYGEYDVHGRSLAQLSQQARAALLADARRWTAAYRPVGPVVDAPQGLVFLAGHQPELFHPGVWFKNFALGALARQHGAAAVNLIIDSDTIKSTSLRTPGGPVADPTTEMVPFDRMEPRVPYEERKIVDGRLFVEFGRLAAEQIAPLVPDPLVRRYWPMVCERMQHTDRVGYCLAQARHQLEGQWGLDTLEVPQSWVCDSESFRWFTAHLIAELPRFREIHNQAIHEYRRTHRIRSASHPAPDLAADGSWVEAPLWIWTEDQPQRRRVFARRDGRETVVSDRNGLELRLPLQPEGNAAEAVEELVRWSRRGIKIRSRALITTLWARLVLGDLFLHGIGGAKYDQVTDRLIERFFGLQAPGIMVLSATLHLPIQGSHETTQPLGEIRQQLRELEFHPERFLRETSPEAIALVVAKQQWIQTPQTPENARARWQSLRDLNAALQPSIAEARQRLLELQAQTVRELQAKKVVLWREYGFCLHPEKILREFLCKLLPKNA